MQKNLERRDNVQQLASVSGLLHVGNRALAAVGNAKLGNFARLNRVVGRNVRPADNASDGQLAKLVVDPDFLRAFNNQIAVRQHLRNNRRHSHVDFLAAVDFAFAGNVF